VLFEARVPTSTSQLQQESPRGLGSFQGGLRTSSKLAEDIMDDVKELFRQVNIIYYA
jgi:hypothetical protein